MIKITELLKVMFYIIFFFRIFDIAWPDVFSGAQFCFWNARGVNELSHASQSSTFNFKPVAN